MYNKYGVVNCRKSSLFFAKKKKQQTKTNKKTPRVINKFVSYDIAIIVHHYTVKHGYYEFQGTSRLN